jgi:hypothetical protein
MCYKLVGEADVSQVWQTSAEVAHAEYLTTKGRAGEKLDDVAAFYEGEVAWMLWW